MIEKIIKENEFIIHSIIKKYLGYFDKDDLYQVGIIGLIEAIKHYDKTKNTKFSSFAYFYVKGEVTKYIRESNLFKISKNLIELNKKLDKVKEYLIQKEGHVPSTLELSLFLEIPESKIIEAENSKLIIESLDKETDEKIENYNFYGYEEKRYKEELIDLRNELSNLSREDRTILEKRYSEGLTQSEL